MTLDELQAEVREKVIETIGEQIALALLPYRAPYCPTFSRAKSRVGQ